MTPPCQHCGGPHAYDTSVPSPLWNKVIRDGGFPDYLCLSCIVAIFALAGQSFTARLINEHMNLRIGVMVDALPVFVDDHEECNRIINALRLRAERAEADADRLALTLRRFCMCAKYAPGVECTHHEAHTKAKAQR